MDTLKIILLRPGEGVWKFTDDREDVSRRSEPPEKW